MLKTCCHKTIELGLLHNQFHSRWNCQFLLRSSERANFHLKNWNSEEGNESTILFHLFFNCKMDFERTSRRSRISSAFTSVKYYKICETFETIDYHISYFFLEHLKQIFQTICCTALCIKCMKLLCQLPEGIKDLSNMSAGAPLAYDLQPIPIFTKNSILDVAASQSLFLFIFFILIYFCLIWFLWLYGFWVYLKKPLKLVSN